MFASLIIDNQQLYLIFTQPRSLLPLLLNQGGYWVGEITKFSVIALAIAALVEWIRCGNFFRAWNSTCRALAEGGIGLLVGFWVIVTSLVLMTQYLGGSLRYATYATSFEELPPALKLFLFSQAWSIPQLVLGMCGNVHVIFRRLWSASLWMSFVLVLGILLATLFVTITQPDSIPANVSQFEEIPYEARVTLSVTMGIVGVLGLVVAFFLWRRPEHAQTWVYDKFTFRRVYAIAAVTFKESIRRRILYVFLVFLLPFLFAGWYLDNAEESQLKFLVAFVTNAMGWLLLPLVVFLSSMSLPNDIKTRTIQTIVTKPVHRLEFLLGRIVGFMAIYTLVVLAMGLISLVYIHGQVKPEVKKEQWTARTPVYATAPGVHEVDPPLPGNFNPRPLMFRKQGNWQLTGTNVGRPWEYRSHVGGPESAHWFFTFDPSRLEGNENKMVRAHLTLDVFKTNKGDPYREGAESAGVSCDLTFYISWQTVEDIKKFLIPAFEQGERDWATAAKYLKVAVAPDLDALMASLQQEEMDDFKIQRENLLGALNALKVSIAQDNDAAIQQALGACQAALVQFSQRESRKVHYRAFRVDNFRITKIDIPLTVFRTGKLEIVARCATPAQYVGMAAPDLYFLEAERSFALCFFKSLLSLWLKVLVLTSMAVVASTVLNSFVTVMWTVTIYIVGQYHDFLMGVVTKEQVGGGPLESLIRLVSQNNQMNPLENTIFNNLAKNIDHGLLHFMYLFAQLVPNLSTLHTANFVAEGFDIPLALMARNFTIIVGYVIPVIIVGYFLLRNREVAA